MEPTRVILLVMRHWCWLGRPEVPTQSSTFTSGAPRSQTPRPAALPLLSLFEVGEMVVHEKAVAYSRTSNTSRTGD